MVAALEPDMESPALDDGFVVPRHTTLRSALAQDETTACVFRTAHDVTMWPVTISEAEYIDGRGALVAAGGGRESVV